MAKQKTGGQAFPHVKDRATDYGNGMTLRDYFAGQALTGLISGRNWSEPSPDDIFDRWANAAYATADAMLEARQKGGA